MRRCCVGLSAVDDVDVVVCALLLVAGRRCRWLLLSLVVDVVGGCWSSLSVVVDDADVVVGALLVVAGRRYRWLLTLLVVDVAGPVAWLRPPRPDRAPSLRGRVGGRRHAGRRYRWLLLSLVVAVAGC